MHLIFKKFKKNINIILQNKWDLKFEKTCICKACDNCKEIEKKNPPLIYWKKTCKNWPNVFSSAISKFLCVVCSIKRDVV
jgi:hypothetical protein